MDRIKNGERRFDQYAAVPAPQPPMYDENNTQVSTLNPTPETPNPKPQTPNPKPETPNLKPQTRSLKA